MQLIDGLLLLPQFEWVPTAARGRLCHARQVEETRQSAAEDASLVNSLYVRHVHMDTT